MNEKIFISIDIIKDNDIEYFLSYGSFFLIKSIKRTIIKKQNSKVFIFFTVKKEYRKFLVKVINNFKKLNCNVKICISENTPKKNNLNALKYYKKNNHNFFIKIPGDSIVDENFILRILEYINKGYSSIFSNLIEVYEDEFRDNFKKKNFRKQSAEKFVFNFLKKNTSLYNLKETNLIKKKNFFIVESTFPRLLAFSNDLNNRSIFINEFQNLGQIILKSYLDDDFKTRYKITDKIISEINENIISNKVGTKDKYRLYIRKHPIQNGNFKFVEINKARKFLKINSKNFFEYFASTKSLDIDFMYYKSLYIYHVYNVYKKKFKIPLFVILILSFIPFTIRKFVYFTFLKKIYSKSDPFYDHTLDRLLFHQSRYNLNYFLNKYFKK